MSRSLAGKRAEAVMAQVSHLFDNQWKQSESDCTCRLLLFDPVQHWILNSSVLYDTEPYLFVLESFCSA